MKYEITIRTQAKKVAKRFGRNYDEQQDIEGRCLEAAWKAEDKVKEGKDPGSFFYKIMQNTALNYLKTQKEVLPLDTAIEDPQDVLANVITQETLHNFVETLDKEEQILIRLLAAGKSINEIASYLKKEPNTVRVKLHRSRKKWSEILLNEKEND